MNVLIDIGHPAHVHYFKHTAWDLEKKGNLVLFVTRDKDVTVELLRFYGFNFKKQRSPYKSKLGKLWGLVKFTFEIFLICKKFKPDILINATFYSAFAAWIIGKPHISIEDTFNKESTRMYMPFTSCVLTGDYDHPSLGAKEISYAGYQELMYLHPKRIQLDELKGLKKDPLFLQKYVFVRFVSWNASHDFNKVRMGNGEKLHLVSELSKFSKIIISAEYDLPKEFKKFAYNIHPAYIHKLLNEATLYVGEGATMASECVMLGTPAIYINALKPPSIVDQEKAGLLYYFENSMGVIDKAKEILSNINSKELFHHRRDMLIKKKIDVSSFFTWFVEDYPKSHIKMKKDPGYQYTFK